MYAQALQPLCDLVRISSRSALQECLQEHVLHLGFSRFQLRLKASSTAELSSEMVIGDYPSGWRDTYDQAGFARIDPVVLHCMHNIMPIIWAEPLYTSPQQVRLRQLALAHGLEHGVTFALHGPHGQFGTLNLNVQARSQAQAHALIERQWGTLSMLRDAALQSALRLMGPNAGTSAIKLTRREKEVLRWGAYGKTSWEISNICCCSEANVDFHFKNIRRKFGVTTRSAAVVQALSMQLIQI